MTTTKRLLLGVGFALVALLLVFTAVLMDSLATETKTATLDDQGNPIAGPTVQTNDAPQRPN